MSHRGSGFTSRKTGGTLHRPFTADGDIGTLYRSAPVSD
jgi:hypothetical protein